MKNEVRCGRYFLLVRLLVLLRLGWRRRKEKKARLASVNGVGGVTASLISACVVPVDGQEARKARRSFKMVLNVVWRRSRVDFDTVTA